MRVFVTGGAGFVGGAIIEALLGKGHSIHALVNRQGLKNSDPRVKSFPGGLFDDVALAGAMKDCEAAIHLVGIIKEKPSAGVTFDRIHYQGIRQVVDAVKRAGIRRYLHMSALGAAENSVSKYQQTKFEAEEYVRGSGLDWTIFEPSLIHGPGGEFTRMEQSWARGTAAPFLFMPYFGPGLLGLGEPAKIQPVFVGDLARAFVESMENAETIGEVFPIGGPQQMTWPQMHRMVAKVIVGHSRLTLGIPAWFAKTIARLLPPALLPFTLDQVLMSQQDNVCDLSKFINAFGWTPQSFERTLGEYFKTEREVAVA